MPESVTLRDCLSISEGSRAGIPEKYPSCILQAPQSDIMMSGPTALIARAASEPSFAEVSPCFFLNP